MPQKRTQPTERRAPQKKLKQQTLLQHFSSSPPPSISKSRKTILDSDSVVHLTDSDSDSNLPHTKHLSRTIKAKKTLARHKQELDPATDQEEDSDSSDVGRIRFETRSSSSNAHPIISSDEDDDERAEPLSPIRSGKRKFVLDSDAEESGNRQRKPSETDRRMYSKITLRVHELDSDSDREISEQRKRSRFVKGKRPAREQEDDDVLDGIDEKKIIENRFRGPKKNKYLENLERLKEKKQARSVISEQTVSDEEDTIPGARKGRDEEDEETSESSTEEEENETNEDNDIESFIVEDDGQQNAHLPAIFSMNTHQDLIHHFKIVCQYMVHLALTGNNARSRMVEKLTSDEYFSISLTIAQRKVKDVRDSVVSSVWRSEFKRALQTYPEFNLYDLEFAIPECHACNLGGRLSKFVGRLSGDPYDKKTFQVLKQENLSDSEDNSTNEGENVPPEFHLGRFCARRTEIYHELCHWEYSLFTSLLNEAEMLVGKGRGYIRTTAKNKPPDDITDADQVMEWLDQRGMINDEWMKLKNAMSRATTLEADVKRGATDDY